MLYSAISKKKRPHGMPVTRAFAALLALVLLLMPFTAVQGYAAAETSYTISAAVTPENSGIVEVKNESGDTIDKAEAGHTVKLTASASDGFSFVEWESDTATISDATNASVSFTMPAANVSVTAKFAAMPAPATYKLTLSPAENGGAATATASDATAIVSDSTELNAGETITISAGEPAEGYLFDSWTVTPENVALNDPRAMTATFTMPESNVVVTPKYVQVKKVKVNGGTAQSSRFQTGSTEILAAEGDAVTITSTFTDQEFGGWTVDEGGATLANAAATTTTFNMPSANVIITGGAKVVTPTPTATPGISDNSSNPEPTAQPQAPTILGAAVNGISETSALLEITAIGTGALNYQWQVSQGSWANIHGATTASYVYGGLTPGGTYLVRCAVSDGFGGVSYSDILQFTTPGGSSSATAITGLPATQVLYEGGRVSWTPAPAGGTWGYDNTMLTLSQNGNTATFTALRPNSTTVTYTANGVKHSIHVLVYSATLPQTGRGASPLNWAMFALSLSGAAAAFWFYCKKAQGRKEAE